jgi:hypothetical protein
MRDSHTHLTLKLSCEACPIGRSDARAFAELQASPTSRPRDRTQLHRSERAVVLGWVATEVHS